MRCVCDGGHVVDARAEKEELRILYGTFCVGNTYASVMSGVNWGEARFSTVQYSTIVSRGSACILFGYKRAFKASCQFEIGFISFRWYRRYVSVCNDHFAPGLRPIPRFESRDSIPPIPLSAAVPTDTEPNRDNADTEKPIASEKIKPISQRTRLCRPIPNTYADPLYVSAKDRRCEGPSQQ
jgi:hypothetical protein